MKKIRVFIENDDEVEDYVKDSVSRIVKCEYEKYITHEVTDASNNDLKKKNKVWKAIEGANEIWLSTSFVGDSGRLLTDMLIGAVDNELRDKVVCNIHSREDVIWHLTNTQKVLIRYLMEKSNVVFLFGKYEIQEYFDKRKDE